jgi:hypothetical protein
MITAILQVIAALLPWIMEIFGQEAKTRRQDEAMDKALANGNVDDIGRLLSERFDRLHAKGDGDPGQPADSGPLEGE